MVICYFNPGGTMGGKKIIAVVGATGSQGGGLARAILNDRNGNFTIRALTRNADNAKELAKSGAEIVEADLNDLESVKKAFTGVHGAYCVTNYWEHFSPEKEFANAETMAKAARYAGVQHVIWSTLEDTRKWVPLSDNRMPTLMGKYKVPHFDAKGEANKVFTDLGLPVTFLLTSFYWDNFIHFGMGPKRSSDGGWAITFPLGDKKMPGIAAVDIGGCAYGIFKKGEEFVNRTIGIAGDQLTGAQMASAMAKVLDCEIRYNEITPEKYRALGFPGADDLGNMFQFYRDFEQPFCGARDIRESRKLNPELQSFDEWLQKNKARIPLE
jgi:uncharacterized protein YbjT (DUF2867 family)